MALGSPQNLVILVAKQSSWIIWNFCIFTLAGLKRRYHIYDDNSSSQELMDVSSVNLVVIIAMG